jgi:hypothetical protein
MGKLEAWEHESAKAKARNVRSKKESTSVDGFCPERKRKREDKKNARPALFLFNLERMYQTVLL